MIKYADMHCDTLTVCRDCGGDLAQCCLQVDFNNLVLSGCGAQCFAVFTEGDGANEKFFANLAFFKAQLEKHGALILPVKTSADLVRAEKEGKAGAILTVENLGFTGGDMDCFQNLKDAGVAMASLVWNNENVYARPNFIDGNFRGREKRGLKPLGRQAVERLDELKIIVDISHLSDGGAEEILSGRKIPIVASHSNAQAACGAGRNLTDGLIKKTALCGGAVGVNFCKKFLGEGNTFESVLKHVLHIIKVGGEDVVALGSDFDGIAPCPDLEDCTRVPALFKYLEGKLPYRVIEKLAYKNFERVFKSVCG